MAKLKLDLHEIYNCGDRIETELNRVIQEATDKRDHLNLVNNNIEGIHGKNVYSTEIWLQHLAYRGKVGS